MPALAAARTAASAPPTFTFRSMSGSDGQWEFTPATWYAASHPTMPAAIDSSSSRSPWATSAPRAATFAAAAAERASPTTWSPRSSSRVVRAPPMKPLAPVTKTRATSGRLASVGGLGVRLAFRLSPALGEEQPHPLHHLAGTLARAGDNRLPEADL